jgi:DNA-directed RNA polymerase subunit RPC12/RpoP
MFSTIMPGKSSDKDLLEGYFDRTTGEFFTLEALGQELHITQCSNCGAGFEKIRLVGEQLKCSYCKSVVYSVGRMRQGTIRTNHNIV